MCDMLFSVEAVVRGHHKYKDIWVDVVGKELPIGKIDLL